MEGFHLFADLPSIEETEHSMAGHSHPQGHWHPQGHYLMRSLNAFGAEAVMSSGSLRLHTNPSMVMPQLVENIPYKTVHWNPAHTKQHQWNLSSNVYMHGHEGTPPFAAAIGMVSRSSSDASCMEDKSSSDDESYYDSNTWNPVFVSHEQEDAYPTSSAGSPDQWTCSIDGSVYSRGEIYTSPGISNASLAKRDEYNGIKLEDVQKYPDMCQENQYNELATSDCKPTPFYVWDTTDYSRSIPEDITAKNHGEESVPALSEDEAVRKDTLTDCDNDDSASDYAPKSRCIRTHGRASKIPKNSRSTQEPKTRTRTRVKSSRVAKRGAKEPHPGTDTIMLATATVAGARNACPQCAHSSPSRSALNKHITTVHTRPFTCTFAAYGCVATFGSKNEWKRHVSSQHLRLGIWRCDIGSCRPEDASANNNHGDDGDGEGEEEAEVIYNDFNRKDLFTQHLRRMHAGPVSDKTAFNASLDGITQRCLISFRQPPPRSTCGCCTAAGKEVVFEGAGAWEQRMEHVGRHLESGHGEGEAWVEDVGLREWMVDEGLIEGSDVEGWVLVRLSV